MQLPQRMHRDGRLVLAEARPRKQRPAEVDGGGVPRVPTLLPIDADRMGSGQRPRPAEQHRGEVRVDPPVARLVGVGQRRAGNSTAKPQRVELAVRRTKACREVPQTFPVGPRRKRPGEPRIPTGKPPPLVIAFLAGNALVKFVRRKVIHQLHEDRAASIHPAIMPCRLGLPATKPAGEFQIKKNCIST